MEEVNLPLPEPHKRRVRYTGTHPHKFAEKYKELAQEQYQEDVQKVMERGQTPAGTHRPICVQEIMDLLKLAPGMVGLDATLGFGGHSREILARIAPTGKLVGLDVDPIELPKTEARLRALGYDASMLTVKRMNFAGIQKARQELGVPFDFVLADLGVSSMQIDNPERGFTFKLDGPLDLRLNPTRSKPACEYLRGLSKIKLEMLLWENADEPYAPALAEAIFASYETGERKGLTTTRDLRELIARTLESIPEVTDKEEIRKSCQRTFQAIRIAVNDEFVVLDQFLEQLPACLAPRGRVAILSFHSGEDRRVKKSFQKFFRAGIYQEIAPDPIRPSPEERHSNPRSSSAKLRWAELKN